MPTGLAWGGPDHGKVRTCPYYLYTVVSGPPVPIYCYDTFTHLSPRQESIRKLWALPKYPVPKIMHSKLQTAVYYLVRIGAVDQAYNVWLYERSKLEDREARGIGAYIRAYPEIAQTVRA